MDMITGAVAGDLTFARPDECTDALHLRMFELFDRHAAIGDEPALYWVDGPHDDPRLDPVPFTPTVYRNAGNMTTILQNITRIMKLTTDAVVPMLPESDNFHGLVAVDQGWGLSEEAGLAEQEARRLGRIRPRVSQRPDRIRIRIMVATTTYGRFVNGYDVLDSGHEDSGERRLHEPIPDNVDEAYRNSPFAQVVRECMFSVDRAYRVTAKLRGSEQ